jgi:hypothetical protein
MQRKNFKFFVVYDQIQWFSPFALHFNGIIACKLDLLCTNSKNSALQTQIKGSAAAMC